MTLNEVGRCSRIGQIRNFKDVVVGYSMVLSRYSPRGTEEHHEIPHDRR
jgi:hypothetical protein